jgi:hypothetical protein
MLLDASVARSIAVLGWSDHLGKAVDGPVLVAQGVLGAYPDEPSELQGIRDALLREANDAGLGSGRSSRALSAANGLDHFLTIGPPTVTVLIPDSDETRLTARLISPEPHEREWRRRLGLRARRLGTGEAVSIAIAHYRHLPFASDDEQALLAYTALTGNAPVRTRDVIRLLVRSGLIDEDEGREGYRVLQHDELHMLGGPEW